MALKKCSTQPGWQSVAHLPLKDGATGPGMSLFKSECSQPLTRAGTAKNNRMGRVDGLIERFEEPEERPFRRGVICEIWGNELTRKMPPSDTENFIRNTAEEISGCVERIALSTSSNSKSRSSPRCLLLRSAIPFVMCDNFLVERRRTGCTNKWSSLLENNVY